MRGENTTALEFLGGKAHSEGQRYRKAVRNYDDSTFMVATTSYVGVIATYGINHTVRLYERPKNFHLLPTTSSNPRLNFALGGILFGSMAFVGLAVGVFASPLYFLLLLPLVLWWGPKLLRFIALARLEKQEPLFALENNFISSGSSDLLREKLSRSFHCGAYQRELQGQMALSAPLHREVTTTLSRLNHQGDESYKSSYEQLVTTVAEGCLLAQELSLPQAQTALENLLLPGMEAIPAKDLQEALAAACGLTEDLRATKRGREALDWEVRQPQREAETLARQERVQERRLALVQARDEIACLRLQLQEDQAATREGVAVLQGSESPHLADKGCYPKVPGQISSS